MADYDNTDLNEVLDTDTSKAEIDVCDVFNVGTDEGV
jgi:hypothetical protein